MKHLGMLCLTGLLSLLTGCSTVVEKFNEDPIQVDPSERSWGNWLDDQSIETIANVNITKADEEFRNTRVRVISFNGTVLLIGQVTNQDLKSLAEETVKKINHVTKVYNELTIGRNASLLEQGNDSWLSTKVKAKLIRDTTISADRVKVFTEKGTVYLMGLITPRKAQDAVNIVRNTDGVQKIVKVFEYIR